MLVSDGTAVILATNLLSLSLTIKNMVSMQSYHKKSVAIAGKHSWPLQGSHRNMITKNMSLSRLSNGFVEIDVKVMFGSSSSPVVVGVRV